MLKCLVADLSYYRYLYGSLLVLTILTFALCLPLFPERSDKFFQLIAGASGFVLIMAMLVTKHNRLGKQNLQIFRIPLSYSRLAIVRLFSFISYWGAVIIIFCLGGLLFRPELLSLQSLLEMFKLSCLIISLMAAYMIMLDLANLFYKEYGKIIFVLTYSLFVYFSFASLAFSFAGNKFDYFPITILFGVRDLLTLIYSDSLALLWCPIFALVMFMISIFTFNLRKTYLIV